MRKKHKLGATKNLKKKETTVKWVEFLWKVAVKCLAGFQSELSQQDGELHAHHLTGKDNLWMRYDLRNGICLLAGQHKYGAHGTPSKQIEFKRSVEMLRGKGVIDRLYDELRWKKGEPNLFDEEERLIKVIAPHTHQLTKWFESKDYKSKAVIQDYKRLFEKLQQLEGD